MLSAGDAISGLGILLFLTGAVSQLLDAGVGGRAAAIRGRKLWAVLGNLSVVGLLVFAAGRALAARR